jgi:two-component system chemotaxis sensor kinase CheA
LVVDGIHETQEIVVKPLGKELKRLNVFAGATIMGDGQIALILDVLGLALRANVISATPERAPVEPEAPAAADSEAREALLLFRAGGSERMAMPLSLVARLEEIAVERVERAAGRDVVQYRGAILPLLSFGDERSVVARVAREQPLSVVVYSEHGKSIGLVVDEILDVVEEVLRVEHRTVGGGLLGCAVIQGRVTDVLDVRALIRRHYPTFFEREVAAA